MFRENPKQYNICKPKTSCSIYMAEEVTLLKSRSSPFGLRIVWALKLKGIRFDSVDEDIANKSPQLLQYNPVHKKIPVLVHNGKPISESLVILEYIEEVWKQNPLLPADDPRKKATARFWAKFNDEKVLPSMWSAFVKEGKEQEEALDVARGNLEFLEVELKGKRFFGGEEIGFADIALGWITNLVPVFEEVLELKLIDEERFSLLSVWMQEFSSVPVVQDTLPPHDKLVTRYRALRERYLPKVPDT